ncbi:MAG: DUF308 domain-containing protein [Firmicutes bacterium]|nr:DUF308 domain-containing protein [Bacillota bacterium]
MRIFTVVIGALFILSGVWCFSHPGLNFLAIAFPIGLVMILGGINALLDFVLKRKKESVSALRLAEGILLVISGLLVIQDLLYMDDMILMFFSMWILFMGALRCTASLPLVKLKIRTWYVTLAVGVVCIIAGILGLFDLAASGMQMVLYVGSFIALHGINIMIMGVQGNGRKEEPKNE